MPFFPAIPAKVPPALVSWRKQLPTFPQNIELPISNAYTSEALERAPLAVIERAMPAFEPLEWMQDLPAGLSAQAMQALVIWCILLYRYTHQKQIGMRFCSANGNSLLLQFRLDATATFQSVWEQVRQVVGVAQANTLPLELLITADPVVERSQIARIGFLSGDRPLHLERDLKSPNNSHHISHNNSLHNSLNLALHCAPSAVALYYQPNCFEAPVLERLIDHWQTLWQAALAAPHQAIAQLQLLARHELEQLLGPWAGDFQVQVGMDSIQQKFEAQVQVSPDRIALESGSDRLTYRELNHQANQLARYLQRVGIQRGDLVGLSLPRSPFLIVGMLGILKAGAAYVALDPTYPEARRQYQLQDSGVTQVLTQGNLGNCLRSSEAAGVNVINLEQIWSSEIAPQSGENLEIPASPSDAAYVIYTSGSTGNPKGVVVKQQGLVNHAMAMAHTFGLERGDRMLQFSNIGFDIIVEEVFPTLISGATLVLRSEEIVASTQAFWQFVGDRAITILDLPTAFWHELVHSLQLNPQQVIPPQLRLVVVGGEKASREAYGQWQQRVGDQVCWLNTYGPTETTVSATIYDPAAAGFDPSQGEIPIGKALANVATYVLDAHQQPVPVGVPGELYIGGAGVAEGYLNREAVTQAKFVANPLLDQPWLEQLPHLQNLLQTRGDRLYRTGDLVRYRPDGSLEFVGRQDFQVKIRGYRIELGEIEAKLEALPTVQQAVVIAHQADSSRDKVLVAYVVPQSQIPKDPAAHPNAPTEWKAALQQVLPHYMVPHWYEVVEHLPLTPNGKVDRKALPAPRLRVVPTESAFTRSARGSHPPSLSPTQQTIIDLWQDILGVPSLDPDSHFFDMGGHSLLVARLCDRLSQLTGYPVMPTVVFQHPTVGQMANWLDQAGTPAHRKAAASCAVPLQIGTQPGPALFCIHVLGEQGNFFRPLAKALGPHQSLYGLAIQLLNHQDCPINRVESIAAYYVQELLKFQPQGPYHLIGISYGGTVAYEMARQLAAAGHPVGQVALLDTYGPGEDQAVDAGRMQGHWEQLQELGGSYLVQKVQKLGQRQWQKLRRRYGKVAAKLGMTLSYELRYDLVLQENLAAADRYQPQPYEGEMVLFRATEEIFYTEDYRRQGLGWRPLVKRLHQVDVPGNHISIVAQPNVQVVANWLRDRLQQTITATQLAADSTPSRTADIEDRAEPLVYSQGRSLVLQD
jgi:amino acid adenylation domain-containing protein